MSQRIIDYAELLIKMEKSVSALRKIGTDEALQAIDPKILSEIDRIKKILATSQETPMKAGQAQ